MWQKMYPTKEERTRSTIMENNYVCSMPQIFKKGDYYYMIGQAVSYGHSVYLYRGETPYGPFTDQKILFNVPYSVDKIGNHDADTAGDNFDFPGSADFCRPYFYRVFNWESIYDEDE